jgi:hypothetical protein
VSDLVSGGGDEVLEDAGADLPLPDREGAHHVVEMRLDDAFGPAQLPQGRGPKPRRADPHLFHPHPGHHELEVGGFDARRLGALGLATADVSDQHLPASDLVEHGLDEGRLHGERARVGSLLGW